ncbi:E3 ubiquitin-protein ligase RNF113A-like [Ruditapes philippinarum]|uniref:E3 ubiquitin-protein ligase RNF113A-like n=1 Tax=Ruditapes philippinarum TaxID=129788 RepID=UPI00295AD0BB|nr:E3 ubiquitin-protein ligase RNF113A-like [Ruditapes philippinarum]
MADESVEEKKVCTFIKKTIRRPHFQRKSQSSGSESSDENDGNVVIKAKRARGPQRMVQSTKTKKVGYDDISDSDSDVDVRKSVAVTYKSSRTGKSEGPQDMGATSTVQIDTDLANDARAIFEKQQEVNKELKGKEDDKVYRGINNYQVFYEKRDTAQGNAASNSVRKGPLRAPAHLRATVRWDYQPDICKDYKETGMCGFGDSCKFLHDRSDYKHGWQLEREMEQGTYGHGQEENYEISSDEDELPFRCFICRKSFVNPVITK